MAFNDLRHSSASGTSSFENIEQMKTSNIVYNYENSDNDSKSYYQSVSQSQPQLHETMETDESMFNKFTAAFPHSPTSATATVTATEFVDNISTSIHSKVSAVNQFIDQIMMFSYDEDGNHHNFKKKKKEDDMVNDKENVTCNHNTPTNKSDQIKYEHPNQGEQRQRRIVGDNTRDSIQRLSDLLFCHNLSCADVKESNINCSTSASHGNHSHSTGIIKRKMAAARPSPLPPFPEEIEVDEQYHHENISKMMLNNNNDAKSTLSPATIENGRTATNTRILQTKILSEASHRHICEHGLPPSLVHHEWNRVYSLSENGDCYENVMTCLAWHSQTLIVVETMDGDVFGGFSASPWPFCNGGAPPPPSTPTRTFLLDDDDANSDNSNILFVNDDRSIMKSNSFSHPSQQKYNSNNISYISDLPDLHVSSIHMASSFGSFNSDCVIPCTPPPSPGTALHRRKTIPLLGSSNSFGTPRTTDSTTLRSSPSSNSNNSCSNRSFYGSGQSFLFAVQKNHKEEIKLTGSPSASTSISPSSSSSESSENQQRSPTQPLLSRQLISSGKEEVSQKEQEKKEKVILYPWTGKNHYIQSSDFKQQRLSMGGGGDDGSFGFSIQDGFSRGTTGPCETFGNDVPLTSPGNSTAFQVLKFEIYGFVNPLR